MKARRLKRIAGFPGRLCEAMDSYGSVSANAVAIKRTEGALRKWRLGKSEPTASDLRAVSHITGAGLEWLVFGGIPRPASAELMMYIAELHHRRNCERAGIEYLTWRDLTPVEKRKLMQDVRQKVQAWVLVERGSVDTLKDRAHAP